MPKINNDSDAIFYAVDSLDGYSKNLFLSRIVDPIRLFLIANNVKIIDKLTVNNGFFNYLVYNDPTSRNSLTRDKKNQGLISFTVASEDEKLTVKSVKDNYENCKNDIISINISDKTTSHDIKITCNKDTTYVETTSIFYSTKPNDIIAYEYNIEQYDNKGKVVPIRNREKLIDDNFATFFNIPASNAHAMRQNFNLWRKKLNESKMTPTKVAQEITYYSDTEEKYTFSKPFKLDDIESFISEEFSFGYNYAKDMFCIANMDYNIINRIGNVHKLFKELCGNNGTISINHELYNSLSNYLGTDENINISTNGVIIINKDQKYSIVSINIKNDQIHKREFEISQSDIDAIYEMSKYNEENKDLKSFLNIAEAKKKSKIKEKK